MKSSDLENILLAIEDRIQIMEVEQHKTRKLLQMTVEKLKDISIFIESLSYDLSEELTEEELLGFSSLPSTNKINNTSKPLYDILFSQKYKVKIEDLEAFSEDIKAKMEELKEFEEELKKNKEHIVSNVLGEA